MKNLKIRLLPGEGIQYDTKDFTVVIIDVLRATTTIAVLLASHAFKVLTTNNLEMARSYNGVKVGERKSIKIEGFDYNNSPTILSKEDFSGKNVILTTSNGTKAVETYSCFEEIITLSFCNFSAVKRFLENKDKILLVCSGSHGEFSLEDFVCAKMMADYFSSSDDSDILKLSTLINVNETNYFEICKNSKHAKSLISKGFEEDVNFSLKMDTIDIVPIYKNKAFVRWTK
jgi:2-phosphosulfolactate phosphatase